MKSDWEHVRIRWPKRAVEPMEIFDTGTWYDFGHIPPVLFARKLFECEDVEVRPQDVWHSYWRLRHDLFGEYCYIITEVRKGAPFAIPVTCWGERI